jgi:tetratricopeptide (TPR) repeat protein
MSIFDSLVHNFFSPFVAIGFYLKKVFWPWPLDFYINGVFRPPYLVLGIVFLLGLIWLSWKRIWWRVWAFWFFCGLLPILPLTFIGASWTPAAERYVYISSISFAVCVSLFAFKVLAFRGRWGVQTAQIVMLVLLFAFGTGTTLRAKIWQSNLALLEDTLEKSPNDGRLTGAYASALLTTPGRKDEAIEQFKRAIDLGFVPRPAQFLGRIEENEKNYAAAEEYYLQALWPTKKVPKGGSRQITQLGLSHERYPDIYLDLVRLHRKMAEEEPERKSYHDERIIHFYGAACKLRPNDPFYKYLLAKAHLAFGDPAEAITLFARVRDMAPDTYYGKAAAKLAKAAKTKAAAEVVGSTNAATISQ